MLDYFGLILYIPVINNFSVMSGLVFLCRTSAKQGLMCLAHGHNVVMPVRLEPTTPPGDKNIISILHLSYRTSDLQFSLVLQTLAQ